MKCRNQRKALPDMQSLPFFRFNFYRSKITGWHGVTQTVGKVTGPLDRSDEDFPAAFLLSRVLGWEARSQAELLRYSYTRVYKAFQERRFPRKCASASAVGSQLAERRVYFRATTIRLDFHFWLPRPCAYSFLAKFHYATWFNTFVSSTVSFGLTK